MTCTYAREQLALYVNGDATAEEREATREHLSGCGECQEIVMQYQSTADVLAGTLGDARPRPLRSRQRTAHGWRTAAVAAAAVLGLLVSLQVPAVASVVGKALPWITIFEMDKDGVADFIQRIREDTVTEVLYPNVYETVAEAEKAWGGRIPLPTGLDEGMDLYQIQMMNWKTGQKDATFAYRHPVAGSVVVMVSNRPLQRQVPRGATSEAKVNGEKALVIRGTFGGRPGQSLHWEPDSMIYLLFPLGDLYYELQTSQTPYLTLDDLIVIAESIR